MHGRNPGPHLIKPGATILMLPTMQEMPATYCGTWVERADVTSDALENVKCVACVVFYKKGKKS
jgi:hypothetical protein